MSVKVHVAWTGFGDLNGKRNNFFTPTKALLERKVNSCRSFFEDKIIRSAVS